MLAYVAYDSTRERQSKIAEREREKEREREREKGGRVHLLKEGCRNSATATSLSFVNFQILWEELISFF